MRTIFNIVQNLKHDCLVREIKVPLVRSFDEEGFKKLDEDFNEAHRTGQTIIPVLIDSYGGDIYSLNGMMGILKSSSLPVATILLSKAMSCGADFFSCGTEGQRYMYEYATIMIHDAASTNRGKVEEIKADAKETERLNDIGYEILARNCGKPKDYFKNLVHERGHADWYITAKEALKHNLTNHIGIPTFSVDVKIETTLSL